MKAKLLIRSAKRGDIPELLGLYKHLSPEDPPLSLTKAENSFEQISLYQGSAILVGSAGDKIVTSCVLIIIPNLTRSGKPYALIENVVTHTKFRNHGYGKAILKEAVSLAWQANCYKAMLLTGSSQPETLGFYQSAGFEQTKTGFQTRNDIA